MKKIIVLFFTVISSPLLLLGQSDSLSESVTPRGELKCHAPTLNIDKLPLLIIYYNDQLYTNKDKSDNYLSNLHPQMLERVEIIKPDDALSKFGNTAKNGVIAVTINHGFLLDTLGLIRIDNLSVE